jgi:hypothetical protein
MSLFTQPRRETVRKVPEVPETWPLGRLSYAIRPESAPVYRPIRRSERCSHPFSDSLTAVLIKVDPAVNSRRGRTNLQHLRS